MVSENTNYYIRINGPEKCNSINDLVIHGEFNVSYNQDGIMVRGSDVLKHIILVVTRVYDGYAIAPFKDVIVFTDDVIDNGISCKGGFNINVKDYNGFEGEGEFCVFCSLGIRISNTIYCSTI